MIVIHERRVAFVHIPRTAGHALQTALVQAFPATQLYGHDWEHVGAHAIRRVLPSPDYRVFTVIRNPWAIFASYYGLLKRAKDDHPDWSEGSLFGLAMLEPLAFPDLVRQLVADNTLACDGGFAKRYCDPETIVFQYESNPWADIAAWLDCELAMERINESLCEPPVWDQASIDLVGHHCRGDVERFGYEAPSLSSLSMTS